MAEQHRWVALGVAPMTSRQSQDWAEVAETSVVQTPLEVMFSTVLCAVCLEQFGDGSEACPGLPPGDDNEHVWQASLAAAATTEDAVAWATDDGSYRPGRPRSLAVICLFCG